VKLLDLSLDTPEENLALDEALLLHAEAHCPGPSGRNSLCASEVLRFWESRTYFVVLGAGGKVNEDVHLANCLRDNIPILRRDSGGGTVLQGPGCLNYTLVLDLAHRPMCADITGTNRYVVERLCAALSSRWPAIEWRGTSDLALAGRKISGTAQRRKKRHILFHGTLLYCFDFRLVERYVQHPAKEPDYRKKRPHIDFLANLDATADELRSLIAAAWQAAEPITTVPTELVLELVEKKYAQRSWNFRF
jgi:lipoate-protein ligase A